MSLTEIEECDFDVLLAIMRVVDKFFVGCKPPDNFACQGDCTCSSTVSVRCPNGNLTQGKCWTPMTADNKFVYEQPCPAPRSSTTSKKFLVFNQVNSETLCCGLDNNCMLILAKRS